MCKKLLSGLFGGGQEPIVPAKPADPAHQSNPEVKLTTENDLLSSRPTPKKRQPGQATVPGLGL